MSANRNQMFVFYIKGDNSIGAGMWSLNWYNDKTTLNKGIEKKLKSGYMPMGFTFYSSKFWVIYIKGRITTGEYKTLFINQSGLEREINKELKKDYFPVGITSDNASNTNGIIFVKDTSADKNKWQLKSHSAYIKTFRKQVINEMKTGWIPFSFIYRGPKTHVFYYKKE
jgi:hypothetical protein